MRTLLGLTLEELQAVACEAGLPRFVGKQLCDWLYKHRVTSFDQMTNISLKARERLKETYCIGRIEPTAEAVSVDGTKKYLFPVSLTAQRGPQRASLEWGALQRGPQRASLEWGALQRSNSAAVIECVYLPEEDRTTLCVSTQAGCKMGCKFCMTGTLGFHGNLSAGDILAQVLYFPDLTNLVLMGEGEPMDNIDNVLRALRVLTAEWGLGWSGKRITVSTVGILQKPTANSQQPTALQRFLDETDCHLAVSLHNPYPAERAAIMPAERLTPVSEVLDLLRQYDWSHQRRLSFEYICWSGVNDDLNHAKQLLRLTQGLPCRVNLIRFHQTDKQRSDKPSNDNPLFPGSEEERMIIFRDYLSAHGVTCTIRKSRGEDILAACGMLVNALSTHSAEK